MRVPADQLRVDRAERVGNGKLFRIGADLRQEYALEDQIADFSLERVGIAAIDRVEHFVRLLEHERAQRLQRLLAIPWATVRSAEPRHDVDEHLEG